MHIDDVFEYLLKTWDFIWELYEDSIIDKFGYIYSQEKLQM